jgi:hypothetical protein
VGVGEDNGRAQAVLREGEEVQGVGEETSPQMIPEGQAQGEGGATQAALFAAEGDPSFVLLQRVKRLRAQAVDVSKSLDKAARALDVLIKQHPWGQQSIPAALKLFSAPEELAAAQLDAPWSALLSDLQAHIDEQARQARQHLLTRLRDAAVADNISFEKLSDNPTTLALQPFTVEIDWDNGRATLFYAREPIDDSLPLDAGAIMQQRAQSMKAIQAAAIPSERFFSLLKTSWQVTLTARGQAEDDRVDLVDLLGPLSLLCTPPDSWRNLKDRDLKPYPRYLFVYQLFRMRRDRALERDGWRLDLGAATGGSTRKKQNVLYIPTSPGDGQYYLTVRFIPASSAAAPPA